MANEKLRALSKQRKWAHHKLQSLQSPTYQGFLKMEEATYQDGTLSKKQKELIAIGISVTIHCESCMQWHIEMATNEGATTKEILEAIDVGMEMGGGPSTASARFALDVMVDIGLIEEN